MWRVRYYNRQSGAEYWKTVWADDVCEAEYRAKRFCRKGFMVALVVMDLKGAM